MSDKRCFECVDRTFRDLLDKKDIPFGGISMLLGGDFRQTFPVKPKTAPKDLILLTLPNSILWPLFTVFHLTINMWLVSLDNSLEPSIAYAEFAEWLIKVGEGVIGQPDPEDTEYTSDVEMLNNLLLLNTLPEKSIDQLIDFVYGDFDLENPDLTCLSNRAIVCPKNDTADDINQKIVDMLTG
ncbi:hypothetical protein LXL04_029185 [Taraxacum kok-saghyz]